MRIPMRLAALSLAAFGLSALVLAQPPVDDDKAFERAVAERLVKENCLICHTPEMVATQRLTAKQWKAEVDKMDGWGAPLPKDQQALVVDYLTETYPATATPAKLDRLTLADALALEKADADREAAGDPARGQALYATNCANCHGADAQGADLGPNLVEKPILYRREAYLDVARNGLRRMPGFVNALDAKAEGDVLAWLRTRKYRGPAPAK